MNNLRLLLLLTAMFAAPTKALQITVTSWGGVYAHAQQRAYLDAYQQVTETRAILDRWGGDNERIRAMVQFGNYDTHVIDAEGINVVAGCEDGILEPIQYERLTVDRDDLLPGAARRCGIGNTAWSMLFVYDLGAFAAAPPRRWADFWDLQRYPGRRGLRRAANPNLEIALLADGVAPSAVYETLRTISGLSRAFEALERIAEHTHWWESGAEGPQRLVDGDLTMTSAWNGRAVYASDSHPGVMQTVWTGQIIHYDYWVIPKRHPGQNLAYKFIDFVSAPPAQAEFARYIPYGPVNRNAIKLIKEDVLEDLPSAPAHLEEWLAHDPEFWFQQASVLEERFDVWLTAIQAASQNRQ